MNCYKWLKSLVYHLTILPPKRQTWNGLLRALLIHTTIGIYTGSVSLFWYSVLTLVNRLPVGLLYYEYLLNYWVEYIKVWE